MSDADPTLPVAAEPVPEALPPHSEPVFNLPGSVIALAAVLAAVQAVRSLLTPELDIWTLAYFAFIPERFIAMEAIGQPYPGGFAAEVWTFVTYAFLHGDWTHLIMNGAFLLAFGAPVARRFGGLRFFVLFAVASAAGALAHLVMHFGDDTPVVGASAAVAGFMGAALRFMFVARGPMGPARWFGPEAVDAAWRVPAPPLVTVLADRRVIGFFAVWALFNVAVGFGAGALLGMGDVSVAWEAHFGGFVAGFFGFGLLDPVAPEPPRADAPVEADLPGPT